jgi:hypothetical protein
MAAPRGKPDADWPAVWRGNPCGKKRFGLAFKKPALKRGLTATSVLKTARHAGCQPAGNQARKPPSDTSHQEGQRSAMDRDRALISPSDSTLIHGSASAGGWRFDA